MAVITIAAIGAMSCLDWGYPKVENSGHRARALDRNLARANAIGTVPIACARAKFLSSALERA